MNLSVTKQNHRYPSGISFISKIYCTCPLHLEITLKHCINSYQSVILKHKKFPTQNNAERVGEREEEEEESKRKREVMSITRIVLEHSVLCPCNSSKEKESSTYNFSNFHEQFNLLHWKVNMSFIFIVPPLPVNYASDFSISMHIKMYIHIRAHSESIIYMFIVEQRRGNSFNIQLQ